MEQINLDEHVRDRDGWESLTVPELIETLGQIARVLHADRCLDDLAEPVRSIIGELEKRRQVALAVADQHDADKCVLKN